MKPSARIQTRIELLERIDQARVPMDSAIGDYMRGRRFIGAKDRADIVEHVYSVMRAHARLNWWAESLKLSFSARTMVMLAMVLLDKADAKRVDSLFDGTQYAPSPLSDTERTALRKIEGKDLLHKAMPEAVQTECPPLHEDSLRAYFGDNFAAEMEAMQASATLDLRVNGFLANLADVKESLEKDGIKTTETPYSPWGLRCKYKAYLTKSKAMNKGWISIQDEGSQMISVLCDAQPGMQVLDYCAGGGGKTLALASAMGRKGRIVAMDMDERRLERGRLRYKKAQLADMIEIRPLSDERNRKWLRRQKGSFDRVLVDVPCSGTGTWRRNPDMRWRVFGPSLEELIVVQAEILDKVANVVKPGGKLIYATCSLLPEENEKQIEAFLARHEGQFDVLPPENGELGSPYMRLTPLRHGTDGFFTAVLVRKAE